ncbi:MAG TPA: SDR family oxidoreductase [Pyrinomonadaceae bacterium]|nr:SDR family oxidoreductase [Chloracidobacterium sp.]MBP9935662.1 SDR family oxidoreductase [Pyrinomonadaceae bacterium]MBK7802238.1 SDR family oxidoreductase [Chloracidobacterium sp.]MBK9437111.1 SDR family oxidoreductase [Chloracidobacterium sp.]MBL0239784.1 SDR family oxidoreductase [Chloracidobacterium sp.]
MSLSAKSVAVVTGAASGIGRALAIKLAEEKIAGIAISDVNEAGLSETADLAGAAGVPISTHIIDVSKIDQVQRLADEAVAAHGGVTHLINNAGVGVLGNFEQLSIEDFEWLMSINFWGVIYGCKVFLPILRQQESAHILNVSSVFGFIAPEEQSAYCASKFAVRGFTESLRHELAGTNVTVSAIHPGGIKTNIARNSRVGKDTPEDWKQQGAKFFDKVARTSPETAADVIVKGIKAKNPRILIGQDAYAISTISRLFPKRYLRLLERLSGHKMSLRKK